MTSVYGRPGEIQWIKNFLQLQVVIIIMAADLWKKMQVNLVKEPNNDFDKKSRRRRRGRDYIWA